MSNTVLAAILWIAAGLVLGEPISPARWLGIACISLGIVLVGLTAHA